MASSRRSSKSVSVPWVVPTIGIGGCGGKVICTLVNSLAGRAVIYANLYKQFLIVDFSDVRLNFEAINCLNPNHDFELLPRQLGEVVGAAGDNWFLSMKMIREKMAEIFRDPWISQNIILARQKYFVLIIHSGGGGTGSGAGPEIAKEINTSVGKRELVLPLLVLSAKGEVARRRLNSLCCFARYCGSELKGFLVVSNQAFQSEFKGIGEYQEEANKKISDFLISFSYPAHITSSSQIIPKGLEAKDLYNLIPRLDYSVPIVPFVKKWPGHLLREITFPALVAITIRYYSLAEYLPYPPPQGILISVSSSSDKFEELKKEVNIEDVRSYIVRNLFNDQEINVEIRIIEAPDLSGNIYISGFIIDPCLPLISEYFNSLLKGYEGKEEDLIEKFYSAFKNDTPVPEMKESLKSEVWNEAFKKYVSTHQPPQSNISHVYSRSQRFYKLLDPEEEKPYAVFEVEVTSAKGRVNRMTFIVREEDAIETTIDAILKRMKWWCSKVDPEFSAESSEIIVQSAEEIKSSGEIVSIELPQITNSCSSYRGKKILLHCVLESVQG